MSDHQFLSLAGSRGKIVRPEFFFDTQTIKIHISKILKSQLQSGNHLFDRDVLRSVDSSLLTFTHDLLHQIVKVDADYRD